MTSWISYFFSPDRKLPGPDTRQAAGFAREQEKLLRERVGIILLLGCVLVPVFGFADYLIFPEKFIKFLTYRTVAALCCLALYGVNRQWNLGLRSLYLGLAGAYIVNFCIIALILETGGYSTPYYAGLSLVFLGMCTVLTANTILLVWHSLILYLIYLAAVILFVRPDQTGLFIVNNMFVISTVAIALVANRIDYQLRLKEFLVRQELDGARIQLERYSEDLENLVTESENMYQMVVDNANEAIFVLQNEMMKFPNPKTLELFGRPKRHFCVCPLWNWSLPKTEGGSPSGIRGSRGLGQ